MAVTANNLVVGGASVSIGGDLGAIKDGITITPTVELLTTDLEQELTPSKGWRMGERFTIEFTLCEPTRVNINYGIDSDNAWTGAGPWTLNFGDQQFTPTPRAIIVTGVRPGASTGTRTITILSALLETPSPIVFTKRQETNLKVVFTALIPTGVYAGAIVDAA